MSLFTIYLLFVKYGLLSFGGGYVLITLFIHDLVDKYKLLTSGEFANLLAIAQMTPGPIGINAATYVGYKTHDIPGGIVATLGLLTPAIFLVILAAFYFTRWEKSPVVQGILSGMRPATLGVIASAVVIFANIAVFTTPLTLDSVLAWFSSDTDQVRFAIRWIPFFIAIASAVTLARFKVNIICIIAAAAVIGAFFIR